MLGWCISRRHAAYKGAYGVIVVLFIPGQSGADAVPPVAVAGRCQSTCTLQAGSLLLLSGCTTLP